MPVFDLSDSGGIGLVLLRGLADAGCLGLFGMALLRLWVAPAGLALMQGAEAEATRRVLRRMNLQTGLAALLTLALWLVFTARALADAGSLGETLSATGIVLGQTSFGRVMTGQALCLAATLACGTAKGRAAAFGQGLGSALLVALQACHGHAFSMGETGLRLISLVHLLAAGAWLGGLPALWLMLRRASPAAAAALSRRFSPLGQIAVLLLAVSALLQGLVMIGSPATLLGTAYGWTALAKLALFLLLLGLASLNRFVATPQLDHAATAEAGTRLLMRSLLVEQICGFLVILAAALLASLPPVMRM